MKNKKIQTNLQREMQICELDSKESDTEMLPEPSEIGFKLLEKLIINFSLSTRKKKKP